ncbi:unnamed protein product [Ectocarpus fasciculatus]
MPRKRGYRKRPTRPRKAGQRLPKVLGRGRCGSQRLARRALGVRAKGGVSHAAKKGPSKTPGSSQKGGSAASKAAGTGTLRISTTSPKSPGSAGAKKGEVLQAGNSASSKAPNAPKGGPKIAKAPGSLGSTPSSTSPGNTGGMKGEVSQAAKAPSATPKTSQKERSTVAKNDVAGSSTGSAPISKNRGGAGTTKEVSLGAKGPPSNALTAKVPPTKSSTSQKGVSAISGAAATVVPLGSTPNSTSPGNAGSKKGEASRAAKKAPPAAPSMSQKDKLKVSKTDLAKTSSGATASSKDPGSAGAKKNSVSQAVKNTPSKALAKVPPKTPGASQTGGATTSKPVGEAALQDPTPPSKNAGSARAKKGGVPPKVAHGPRESGFGDRSREHSGGEKEEGEIDVSMKARRRHVHGAAASMTSATNPNPAWKSRSPPVTGFSPPPPPRRGMNEERGGYFSVDAMRGREHTWNSRPTPVTGFAPPPPPRRGMNGEREVFLSMEAMRRQEHAAPAFMSSANNPNPAWSSLSPPVTGFFPPPPPRRDMMNGEGGLDISMRGQENAAAASMSSANNPNPGWNSRSPPVTGFFPPPPPRRGMNEERGVYSYFSVEAMRRHEHAWNSLSPPVPGDVPPPPPRRGKIGEGGINPSMEATQRQEHAAAASTSFAPTPNPASSQSQPVSGKFPPPPPQKGLPPGRNARRKARLRAEAEATSLCPPGRNAAKKARRKARLRAEAEATSLPASPEACDPVTHDPN